MCSRQCVVVFLEVVDLAVHYSVQIEDEQVDQLAVVGFAVPTESVSDEVSLTDDDGVRSVDRRFPQWRKRILHLLEVPGAVLLADDWIAASLPEGVTTADVAPFVAQLEQQFPQVSIDTSAEFREQFEGTIDSALLVVNALLALAIVIALIGIANTLALSVHERTRELGLLRAVGMTRRQTRRMVRWEAVLVALFGSVLGVAAGTVFGWGVVSALPADSFGGSLTIPVPQIVQVVLLAAVATLVAAWLPARRAGKLNVLDAISQ